jgi:hypothetical protein
MMRVHNHHMGEAIMARKSLKKLILSLSVATVLTFSWSGSVIADADEVAALEARVAELESLVHQLLANQQTSAVTVQMVEEKATEVAIIQEAEFAQAAGFNETSAAASLKTHQDTVAEKAHKHNYKFGGFVKTDVIYSDYSSGSYSGAGRDFYIPGTIPVGDGEGESYLDFHAKESRINFKSTHNLDNGAKIGTFLEMDFQLPTGGNERVSNSFNPRIRHAFVTYNKWLVGQTWMTFFNVGALPENLDFVGPAESTIFGRQPMIRYTTGSWQFAAENPETTITPYGGGGRIVADDNMVPDLVVRYNMKGDWGTFTVAGTYRELAYNNNAGIDDSTGGYGISLSGKFVFGNKDDFRWMASTGSGMGRYMGLNTANGAVLDADGNLQAIDSWGAFGSFRHLWSDKWRSNATLGYLSVDNDTELTGMGVTKIASSVHLNLIYSPQPKLDFGVEFMYADREIESGADGDKTRLQFSAKYAY